MMVEIPIVDIEGEDWILLKHLCDSFTFRAVSIKHQGRVKDPSDHRVEEAKAKGSVKCKPRAWDISQVLKQK